MDIFSIHFGFPYSNQYSNYSKLFLNSELEGVLNFENLSKILEFKFTFGHVFPEKDVNWIPRGDTLIQHRYPK